MERVPSKALALKTIPSRDSGLGSKLQVSVEKGKLGGDPAGNIRVPC